MKILVIGGAGFIGSHLVDKLSLDDQVTVVDDLSSGNINNINISCIKFKRINFLAYKTSIKYDKIYNFAAKIDARSDNIDDLLMNIDIVRKSVKMLQPNGEYHFASSCAVYGENNHPTEMSDTVPTGNYGISKLVGEQIIQDAVGNYFIYRFANVFGERQDGSKESGIVAIIRNNKANHTAVEVFNKGVMKRDYIYVKDIVDAILMTKPTNEIYNLGTGKCYKTIDLIKASCVKYFIGRNQKEIKSIKLNINKVLLIHWKPTIDVLDYLK